MARLTTQRGPGAAPVLVCAGGTGGHLFPAQALAEELGRRGIGVHLATDARGGGLRGRFPAEGIHILPAATIRSHSPLALARTAATLAHGFLRSLVLIGRLRPRVVVGFGGYPTLPPLLAARALRVPSVLHEQNAVMGRANRFLSRFADAIAVSFAATDLVPAAAKHKLRHTGIPVRGAVIEAARLHYEAPAPDGALRLLVFGGSQGARAFSQLVPAALAGLPEPMRKRLDVVQQARPEDVEQVRAAYLEAGITSEVAPFFGDLPWRMGHAHLIVARSGASTVAEITVIGRPAILVPLPGAIDNDQLMNARALERAGAARLMPQSGLTAGTLGASLAELLGDPGRLADIAAAAGALGRQDAVARLADLVVELGGGIYTDEERAT